jgi:cation-transporting ATPase E
MASGSEPRGKWPASCCSTATLPRCRSRDGGPAVINNIRRSASLFLTKTVFTFLLSPSLARHRRGLPLRADQLTLFSTASVGMPSFLLALEPNRTRVEGRFMPYVLSKALPGGLTIALGAWVLSSLAAARELSGAESGTLATLYLVAVGLMVLLAACWPLNLKRAGVLLLAIATLAVALIGFPWFFELTALSPASLQALAIAVTAAVPCFFGLNALFSRVFRRILSSKTLHP